MPRRLNVLPRLVQVRLHPPPVLGQSAVSQLQATLFHEPALQEQLQSQLEPRPQQPARAASLSGRQMQRPAARWAASPFAS